MSVNEVDAADGLISGRRLRPLLGTFVAIECLAANQALAERAIESGFAAVRCVAERMHPTRPGSDLAHVRESQIGCPVSVHPWTWQVLALSKHVHELSEGFFDPCLPSSGGRFDAIHLLASDVVVRTAPVAIDLGGIAKGFAVDRAIDALQEAGCGAGLVNAGGDMRAFGPNVRIWVRTRASVRPIELQDQACAISDVSQPNRPAEHRGYYSRVEISPDLATVEPAIVLAPTAALADALTKCVLLLRAVDRRRTLNELLASSGAMSL